MNQMRRIICGLLTLVCCMATAQTKTTVTVDKIWDNGTHAAFTSLIKYKGRFYCSFREGYSHIFDENGKAEGKCAYWNLATGRNGTRWLVSVAREPTCATPSYR